MGHQFARSAVAAALALSVVASCGGDDDASPVPVLDNARRQAASVDSPPSSNVAGTGGDTVAPEVTELPAPDPSQFEGANRVVNLWVGADGQTRPVDVWGRRTFTSGPILLVENLEFGESSDYFASPAGYSLVVVGSGAGPDGDELAGMFNAGAGDQVTMIFTNDDADGTVSAPNLWEQTSAATGLPPDPPARGTGLVWLYAPNTLAFDESLTSTLGGSSFYVGTGSKQCAPQRVEQQGFQPNVLGGTQHVQLELPPGEATIALYPWFSPDRCDQPATLEFTVEVPTDEIVMVLVYSSDGKSIDTLELPVRSG